MRIGDDNLFEISCRMLRHFRLMYFGADYQRLCYRCRITLRWFFQHHFDPGASSSHSKNGLALRHWRLLSCRSDRGREFTGLHGCLWTGSRATNMEWKGESARSRPPTETRGIPQGDVAEVQSTKTRRRVITCLRLRMLHFELCSFDAVWKVRSLRSDTSC